MDIYREEISRIVYDYKKMLEDYTNEQKKQREHRATQGNINSGHEEHLIRCRNNGKDTYYRAYRENGRYVRKTLGNNQDAINELARKEYLRIVISTLESNIDVLETSLQKLKDLDLDTVRTKLHKVYRELPEECFFINEPGRAVMLSKDNADRYRNHRQWATEPYEKSNYMSERRRFMTSGGFKVRSKSEQHIVEQLINYDVPFRYEQVIHIDGLSYSADFTFRERNGELFYWEHAGMMDEPSYVESHYRKMKSFEGAGIVPWKNLIVTYDMEGVINIPAIKGVIENEVIPRL